ncbi:MAG TPA: flagellar basal body-associated FliL family protein [Dissulfurispiraceae bacterium]
MEYDLSLLVVKDKENSSSKTGFYDCVLPSLQSGLEGGQRLFILWSKEEPLIEGGNIVCMGRQRDFCKALSVTDSYLQVMALEDEYALGRFDFIILDSLSGADEPCTGAAVKAAKRLEANGADIKDILVITNEGLPREFYSDTGLYGIACINRLDIRDMIKKEMCLLIGSSGEGLGEKAVEMHTEARNNGSPAAETYCPREEPSVPAPVRRRMDEVASLAVFALAAFIIIVSLLAGTKQGTHLLSVEPQKKETAATPAPPGFPRAGEPAAEHPAKKSPEQAPGRTDEKTAQEGAKESVGTAVVSLAPFEISIANHGRVLKAKVKLQLSDAAYKMLVENRIPQLRNTVIACMREQSVHLLSTRGKSRLRSTLITRANRTMGKDVFTDLYFTEFVVLAKVRPRETLRPPKRPAVVTLPISPHVLL